MTYAYGMKGAPAVGQGLPGLPRREAGGGGGASSQVKSYSNGVAGYASVRSIEPIGDDRVLVTSNDRAVIVDANTLEQVVPSPDGFFDPSTSYSYSIYGSHFDPTDGTLIVSGLRTQNSNGNRFPQIRAASLSDTNALNISYTNDIATEFYSCCMDDTYIYASGRATSSNFACLVVFNRTSKTTSFYGRISSNDYSNVFCNRDGSSVYVASQAPAYIAKVDKSTLGLLTSAKQFNNFNPDFVRSWSSAKVINDRGDIAVVSRGTFDATLVVLDEHLNFLWSRDFAMIVNTAPYYLDMQFAANDNSVFVVAHDSIAELSRDDGSLIKHKKISGTVTGICVSGNSLILSVGSYLLKTDTSLPDFSVSNFYGSLVAETVSGTPNATVSSSTAGITSEADITCNTLTYTEGSSGLRVGLRE